MRSDSFEAAIRAVVPRPVRNWLRSPSKTFEWLWDAGKYSLGVTETLEFPRELTLVCHPHVYRVASRAQVLDPEQRDEFRNFLVYCNSSMFLFDLGAHFGLFSLAAAHFGGKAIAVDPSPIATRMISRQLTLNRSTDRIRIIQAAVTDSTGSVEMVSSGVFSDGYFKFSQGRARSELTRTPSTTIDEIAFQFGTPTHIKIDVEGQEAAVLRGGRKTLEKYSPILFLELHNEMVTSEGGDPDLAVDELGRHGYVVRGADGIPLSTTAILDKPIIRVLATKAS